MERDLDLLRTAARMAIDYVEGIDARAAAPTTDAIAGLREFDEPLTPGPNPPDEALQMLDRLAGPATVGSTGPNYFGFVTGATHPVALGASFLVNAWDQNAALPVMSPAAAALHDVSRRWLNELLGFHVDTEVAYLTGATVANASCLAAARDALLDQVGWDAQRDGLFGAPPIHVVIGAQAHSTLRKSLGLVGLGRERVTIVPSDAQGRTRADALPDRTKFDGPVLLCAQAGEVNTGAFDPFDELADWLGDADDAWMHVDGAFGLWALADPSRAVLVSGLTRADSWATDGHKWLNVTYDCGIAFVRPGALRRTFAALAGYLPPEHGFEAMHHTPQSSQRARQVEVWAVLRTLGRHGVADMVRRACDAAIAVSERLAATDGFDVLNDVVLNQVLVRYRDGAATEALLAEIQRDGRVWCGATQWCGSTAMRVSVSSWKTTIDDALRAADVMIECAGRLTP